jgi:hypothetical protein
LKDIDILDYGRILVSALVVYKLDVAQMQDRSYQLTDLSDIPLGQTDGLECGL